MEKKRSSSSDNFNSKQTLQEECNKKQKKVSFSENDSAALSQRYDASVVLTLLQEMANHAQWKFNWNELVEKTSTGITSAREYQMLWRHLAYGHPLINQDFDDHAPPLDDDSDLECEREALPPADYQTATQTAACVKVMISSATLSQSDPTSSLIEAPLNISVPVCGSSNAPSGGSQTPKSMEESNIIFPVTVQRETRLNVNVPSTNGDATSSKKKRIGWSEEEDVQLRAAVQKWGEGNWTNMATKVPLQRTASQLSKRWSILKKRDE